MAQSQFSIQIRPVSWRYLAVALVPALFVGIAESLRYRDLFGITTFPIVVAVLAGIVRLMNGRRKGVVSIEPDGVRLAMRWRQTVVVPWLSVRQIRMLETTEMPLVWRLAYRLWGYGPSERWVEVRAKGMLRATRRLVKANGIGFPLFSDRIYLPDLPVEFASAAEAYLHNS